MSETIRTVTHCPTCGVECRMGGVGEKAYYIPLPNRLLWEFAKKHHDVCEECEGTGRVYKHHDPTTGQWTPCPYAEAIMEGENPC